MTLGILAAAAALVVAAAIVTTFLACLGRKRIEYDRDALLQQRDHQARELEGARAAAEAAIADLTHAERDRGRLEARLEQLRAHAQDLEAELEPHRSSPLEGRTIVANTPKPDDQAIRGVVMRELAGGGLLLAGAVYLDASRTGDVVEVPAGDVVVPRVSWSQLLTPTQEG